MCDPFSVQHNFALRVTNSLCKHMQLYERIFRILCYLSPKVDHRLLIVSSTEIRINPSPIDRNATATPQIFHSENGGIRVREYKTYSEM